MHERWPLVKLGEVARHRTESIQIDDFQTYLRCRVQLHARGIVQRDKVPGTEIKTKTQWVAVPDDFLVAEIDAKLGGYGIVPKNLAGAVVSSHYFLFELNQDKIMPRWLDLFCRTESFHSQVAAQGSTNYSAVRPKAVLGYALPLPSRTQQAEIVERVDTVFKKLDEAKRLAASMAEDFDRLLIALAHRDDLTQDEKLARGWRRVRLGEVMAHRKRQISVNDSEFYSRVSIRLWGKGIEKRDRPKGVDIKTKMQYVVHTDDFLVAEMDAKFGAFGILPKELDGAIVSSHYFAFEVDRDIALPEWLLSCSKGASFQEQVVARGSTNYSAVRPKQILDYQIWLPPMAEQNKIAEVLNAKRQYDALDTFEKDAEALRHAILSQAFRGEW